MPVLSKVRSVGLLSSPVGYSKILFDSISRLDILFPVISVNHTFLPSGDRVIPMGPEFGVGILKSSIFPFFIFSLPIKFVLASVNHRIFLLLLSNAIGLLPIYNSIIGYYIASYLILGKTSLLRI
jgi:hypothetical protein